MVSKRLLSLLYLSSALVEVFAAPTKAQCRCVIVESEDPSVSPSSDNYGEDDICSSLGPELEQHRITNPMIYHLYVEGHADQGSSSSFPFSRHFDISFATPKVFDPYDASSLDAPSEDTQSIVCRSAFLAKETRKSSRIHILYFITGVGIVGGIIEALVLVFLWYVQRTSPSLSSCHLQSCRIDRRCRRQERIQVLGPEKLLHAHVPHDQALVSLNSKKHTYLTDTGVEDDDEFNSPVM